MVFAGREHIPEEERGDMIAAYYKRLTSSDQVFAFITKLSFWLPLSMFDFVSLSLRRCAGLQPRSGVYGRWGQASSSLTLLTLTR